MSDNFSVSVELKGKATGTDQLEGVRTQLLAIGRAAKETTKLATESARELARAWASSMKGDVTAGVRSGIKEAQAQVDTLTARLKALYALKATGEPVANLSHAIKQVSADLEVAQDELKALSSLTKTTSADAKVMAASLAGSFKGDVTMALRTGLAQAKAQVDSVTQKLRALYAQRSTGTPMDGLKEAIEETEQELREAQYQLNQLQNTGAAGTKLDEQMGVGGLIKGLLSAQVISLAIRETWLAVKNTFMSIVDEGLKMNEELEAFDKGIAANITALYELKGANGEILTGQEKYTASLEMSKAQMYELRKAGIKMAATSLQLGKSFQSALAVAGSSGIRDLDTIRKLTIGVANAATALVIPQEEAVVALRAIITGREVEQSTLARTLVTTGEQVRQWKEQGILVDKLMEKLQPYTDAAERNADAWKVVKSTVEEVYQVFAGTALKGFFEQLKLTGMELIQVLDPNNLGIVEKYAPVVAVIQQVFTALGAGLRTALTFALSLLESISNYIKQNEEAINDWLEGAVKVWEVFKVVLTSVGSILVTAYQVGDALGQWKMALEGVKVLFLGAAVAVAGISDAVRAVGTWVVTVGALIGNSMLDPIAEFMTQYSKALGAVVPGVQASEIQSAGNKIKGVVKGLNADALSMWKSFDKGVPALNKLLDAMEDRTGKIDLLGPDAVKKAIADMKAIISGIMGDKPADLEAEKRARDLAERIAKVKKEADVAYEKARLEGEVSSLEDQLKIQEISITEYYTRLTDKQLESIEIEKRAREDALQAMTGAENEPERIRLQGELNVLRLEEGKIIDENRIKQRDALNELQTKMNDTATQLAELMGVTTPEQIFDSLKLKMSELRAQVAAQFGEGAASQIDKFVDVKAAKESFALVKAEYDRTLEEMRAKEAEIGKLREAGTLSPVDSIRQLDQIQKDYTVTLSELIPKLQEYADKVGSPELKAQLEQMKIGVNDLKNEQSEFGKTMGDAINSGWVDMWQSFADGTKTAGEAFKDFARGILSTFTKLMTEIIAKAMMAKMLQSMGSSGGWGSIFSSIFSGMAKADGGYISGPGTGTSDSIPARLSNGEYVIKASSVRRIGVPFLDALNGGKIRRGGHFFADGGLATAVSPAGGDSSITVGLEEGLVARHITAPSGQKAVLKIIENNPQFIRSLLS